MKHAVPVRLLVCGNGDRADDGAALRAVRSFVAGRHYRIGRDVSVERCDQLDVLHLLDVPSGQALVIVDTAVGVAPGEVVTTTLEELIDHPEGPAPHSSHSLPINQVLGVANVLAEKPLEGLFVGIGGSDFGFGQRLSEAVVRGLPAFVSAIDHAVEALLPLSAATARGT
jgi:hydrogenase maturation protease